VDLGDFEGVARVRHGRFTLDADGAATLAGRIELDSPTGAGPGGWAVWRDLSLRCDGRGDVQGDALDAATTSGTLAVAAVSAAGAIVENLALDWATRGLSANWRAPKFTLYEGVASASGHVDLTSETLRAEARGRVDGLDLAAFTERFPMGDIALAGRVDVTFSGAFAPDSAPTLQARVAAERGVEINKATIRRILAWNPTFKTGGMFLGNPMRTLERRWSDRDMVPFDEFVVEVDVTGDAIAVRLTMRNEAFNIVIEPNIAPAVALEFLRQKQAITSKGANLSAVPARQTGSSL